MMVNMETDMIQRKKSMIQSVEIEPDREFFGTNNGHTIYDRHITIPNDIV